MVYKDTFTKSIYLNKEEAAKKYWECSWYLENEQIIPYEYSNQNLTYDFDTIVKHLNFLEKGKYEHYRTTVRPIQNVNEL